MLNTTMRRHPYPKGASSALLGGAVCLVAVFSCWAVGEEELLTVRAEGVAEGTGASAREMALESARKDAVEQVLRSLVATEDITPLRAILRHASRYVRSHELLRTGRDGGQTVVEADVRVLVKPLQYDVAVTMLPRLPSPPKVLVVVGERVGSDKIVAVPDFGIGETALRKGMKNQRLDLSGTDVLGDRFNQAQLIEAVTGGIETGRRFTVANRADVVMLGAATTTAEPETDGTNVHICRAEVHLCVFRGFDGKMTDDLVSVATVRSANVDEGSELAVEDACEKLVGDAVVAAVLTALGTQQSDAVLLTVERPGSRTRFGALVVRIETEFYVGDVEELHYSEDIARVRVPYDGPMAHFVDVLSAYAYDGVKFEVQRAVGREMVVSFP